jgi:hypothetical protein
MDATITRGNPETFADETYRGYRITYVRPGCIFEVSDDKGYRRGVGQTRKQAQRWIDLLISGEVK